MLKYFIGFILCILVGQLNAQTVKVVDADTRVPVYLVSITRTADGKVFFTNEEGKFDVDLLSSEYVFSHSSYEQLSLNDVDIKALDFEIVLHQRTVQIDEVVVSANKWEQDKSVVPNEIVSLSAKEVEYLNPQTSADLLAQSGQVYVQKSQLGGGSPMIRGFAANSVLIMMDGIRINNAIYRSGNLQNVIMMDPNIMESTNVVFGPGSAIYGSDALGGVMVFNTLRNRFGSDKRLQVGGQAMTRYSSANQEKTGHVMLHVKNKWVSNITTYTHGDFGDLRSGNNRPSNYPDFGKRLEYIIRQNGQDVVIQNDDVNIQRFSGYHQYNVMNKLSVRLSDFSHLTHQFFYTNSSDVPRYDRLIQRENDDNTGNLVNADWYYGPQKFMLNAVTFSNFRRSKFYDAFKVIISTQQIKESRHDRKFQSDELRNRTEDVDVYALNIDVDKDLNSKSELFYGLEAVLNDVTSTANTENIVTGASQTVSTRYPDGDNIYRSIATYGSLTTELNQRLIMTMGLRYTHIYLRSEFVDKTFFNFPYDELELHNGAISGTFGLVINPAPNFQWNLLFSTGFRAPNLDDIGKVFDSEPGVVVVPNEGLAPEFTYNYESSINWRVNPKLRFEGSIFYTNLVDAMVRRPFTFNGESTILYDGVQSEVQALVNAGEAFIWGYSIGLNAQIGEDWRLKAQVSNNTGKDEIENIPLRHTNPLFGKVSFSYNRPKFRFEFFTNYQAKRDLSDFPPSEQNKAHLYTAEGSLAWYTINFRSTYRFTNAVQVTASLENILDKHYRTYSSGISAAGINGVLSLRASF